jgi:hypothetical protein
LSDMKARMPFQFAKYACEHDGSNALVGLKRCPPRPHRAMDTDTNVAAIAGPLSLTAGQ